MSDANVFVREYSHWFTLVSTLIGILGSAFGAYNLAARRIIIRQRNNALYATLQNMHRCKATLDDKTTSQEARETFQSMHYSFLTFMCMLLRWTPFDIDRLLEKSVITREERDYLSKIHG